MNAVGISKVVGSPRAKLDVNEVTYWYGITILQCIHYCRGTPSIKRFPYQ